MEKSKQQEQLKKERSVQQTLIKIKNKYGKNAIVKGMNLEEGGTTIDRNGQIGGHKA
jgi:DNA polymerase V